MATTRTSATRVLIVDDHRTFAEAIAAVVTMQPDMSGHAVTSGSEAERAVTDDRTDVVLLGSVAADDEPGSVGRLLARAPGLRILIVTENDDEQLRARTGRAGAYGVLTTFDPIERILEAIRASMNGERMDALEEGSRTEMNGKRRRQPYATEHQRSDRLSAREREILQLIADGSEPPQIVQQLGITPATLRTHVQNILTKLRVHSKTQAVLMAIRQGKVTGRR